MIPADVLSIISAGGDMALVALVWIMWRFDRRLLTVELSLLNHINDEERKLDLLEKLLRGEKINGIP